MGSPSLAVGISPFPPISDSNNNGKNSFDRTQTLAFLHRCKSFSHFPQIHAKLIKDGHEQDTLLLAKVLEFCARHKSMDYASKVFERVENPNSLLYTALIGGQVAAGCYLDAIRFYARMIETSVMPNPAVLSSLLKACGCLLALSEARELHGRVLKLGLGNERLTRMKLMEFYAKCGEFEDAHRIFAELPERDVVASTVMISCYSCHGLVEKARGIFDKIPAKDTICWTAMIDGLVQTGQMNEALELFREMQREEVRPNEVTIVCLLSACSHLGALEIGRWIHSYVGKYNIKLNVFVGSVLIGMYSKCGSMEEAERVFRAMPKRDVVTYNSMIVGLALHGKSRKALEMFRQMIEQGVRPTHVSFVGVLNACSHGGLVEMGYKMFGSMNKDFGLEPQIEHYGCMVDLLGRVGHLEEAYHFVRRMKIEPDNVIWGALLSACKIHENLDLGERVAKIIVEKGIADSGTYVLMSGVYASSGKWELAARARAKMKEMGIQKEVGCSSIVVNNEIHEFILGDIKHSQREEIYKTLEDLNVLLKAEGYCPETKAVLQDIEEGDKEWALAIHSERLAICYGLISTAAGTTIRVVKNLRVCNDCHSMIKLIAKITRRTIIMRDRNRFHHFEDGFCSCGDYW